MSAEAPTSRQLRRLGAVVIILIFGLGFAASKIPDLLRPESLTWVVTVPARDGADGIKIGSQVLVGGIKQGRVISVSDIKQIIRHLRDKDIGVLITDHNVRETLDICENAYIVSGGHIIASGSSEDILANQQVKEVYLGNEFKL